MLISVRASAFPNGVLEQVRFDPVRLLSQLRSRRDTGCCPRGGRSSARIHSRALRQVQDLLLLGIPVQLHVRVRRLFCTTPDCAKHTVVEHLPADSD